MGAEKILAQGAEAKIILTKDFVVKDRIKKSYRIKELDDKIRKLRTRSEAKILEKAGKIISVPKVIEVDEKEKKIKIEFIDGFKLSEHLDKFELKKQKEICKKIGEIISKLHKAEIIHGDLTTSNMILKDDEVYFIDFGLGFISRKFEDKAVDLHLLKQALEAKHFKNWEGLWKEVEKGYNVGKEEKIVLERLKTIEKRGRYKEK
jgi:TP53 regulating kinase and related kinases